MTIDTRQQWTHYWRQGHLTSLPQGFSSNYDGDFLRFWNEQFLSLEPNARVLDVCCGNGSVALLAQNFADQRRYNFSITATDAAAIDTSALVQLKPEIAPQLRRIEFLPNTPLETLSIEAASVDLISSQFGIEYTDWQTSAAHIAKGLRPGGAFAMICHDVNSKIMTRMARQQNDYAAVFETDLFSQDYDEHLVSAPPALFLEQLALTLDSLYSLFQKDRTSHVFSAVGKELEQIDQCARRDLTEGFRRFSELASGIRISYGTSSDLLSVYERLRRFPNWFEAFSNAGLTLESTGTIYYQTHEPAGKSYCFKKST